MNLVDQIKKQFTDADINRLSSMIGASEGATRSAVGAAVPSILAALSGLANSGTGAQKLVSALGQVGTNAANVTTVLSDSSGAAIEKGNNLLNSLFGGSSLSGIQNGISRFAGVAWGGCQKLLGVLTPAILGAVASRFAGRPLNQQSLAGLFTEQKAAIASAVPSGFSLPDIPGAVSSAAGAVSDAAVSTGRAAGQAVRHVAAGAEQAAASASRWLLPLLGILALGLLAWWLWPKAATPSTSLPAVPELPAYAAQWKNDVTGAVTQLTDTLGTVRDAASLDAALPKFKEIDQTLESAKLKVADVPVAAKTAVVSAVKPALTTLQNLITKVLTIPGAMEKLKPITDSIMAKLNALAT